MKYFLGTNKYFHISHSVLSCRWYRDDGGDKFLRNIRDHTPTFLNRTVQNISSLFFPSRESFRVHRTSCILNRFASTLTYAKALHGAPLRAALVIMAIGLNWNNAGPPLLTRSLISGGGQHVTLARWSVIVQKMSQVEQGRRAGEKVRSVSHCW